MSPEQLPIRCLLWVSDLLLSCNIPPGYQSDPQPFPISVHLLHGRPPPLGRTSSFVAGCHTRLSSPSLRFNEFECPVCYLSETYFGKLIFNTLVSFFRRCKPWRHATAGISRNAGIKATIKKYRPCIIRESMCISGNLHIEAERLLPSSGRTALHDCFRAFLSCPLGTQISAFLQWSLVKWVLVKNRQWFFITNNKDKSIHVRCNVFKLYPLKNSLERYSVNVYTN